MNSLSNLCAGRRMPLSAHYWLCGLLCLLSPGIAGAVTFTESFTANPLANGWRIFGDTNLFQWDATNQNLAVTWENSQTNSYFYRPLGTILAKSDAFSVSFDLQLTSIAANSPQIAVGLFNYSQATNSSFSRPGATTPDLFEFDYYADNGIGQPSITATLTDTNVSSVNKKDFYFIYDNLPLNVGTTYHIVMNHAAGTTNLTALLTVNGLTYTSLPVVFPAPITDFRIDTLSISSYGGGFIGTPASGVVDNLSVTLPPPPIQNLSGTFSNGLWRAAFACQTNWVYTLQRTTNFALWSNVVATNVTTGTVTTLSDTNPFPNGAFYRVQATRP